MGMVGDLTTGQIMAAVDELGTLAKASAETLSLVAEDCDPGVRQAARQALDAVQ